MNPKAAVCCHKTGRVTLGLVSTKDSRFLNGQVDEFRIYNYAMEKDDIPKVDENLQL